jgi:hydroxymethylpyrimidine pyrophosphatase-like HAD family hydrolase
MNNDLLFLDVVPIDTQLTYLLFLKAYELDVSCHVYTENLVYFNFNDVQYDWYKKSGCDCRFVDMGSADLGLEEAPLKFLASSTDRERLERFMKEMHEVTKQSLNAEFTSEHSLIYTSIHTSKGLGMEYIYNLSSKSTSEAVATRDRIPQVRL